MNISKTLILGISATIIPIFIFKAYLNLSLIIYILTALTIYFIGYWMKDLFVKYFIKDFINDKSIPNYVENTSIFFLELALISFIAIFGINFTSNIEEIFMCQFDLNNNLSIQNNIYKIIKNNISLSILSVFLLLCSFSTFFVYVFYKFVQSNIKITLSKINLKKIKSFFILLITLIIVILFIYFYNKLLIFFFLK